MAGLLPGPSELRDSPEYSLCWAPAASPADRDQEVSLAYTPYFPLHYLESPSFFCYVIVLISPASEAQVVGRKKPGKKGQMEVLQDWVLTRRRRSRSPRSGVRQPQLTPVFVKNLMKHHHTSHLRIVYGCVCASTTAELKDCD